MRYWKATNGDYITGVGTGISGTEISETEYVAIITAINNKPQSENGYDYHIRKDMTYELYRLPDPVEEDSPTESELLNILLGGAE